MSAEGKSGKGSGPCTTNLGEEKGVVVVLFILILVDVSIFQTCAHAYLHEGHVVGGVPAVLVSKTPVQNLEELPVIVRTTGVIQCVRRIGDHGVGAILQQFLCVWNLHAGQGQGQSEIARTNE